MKTEEEKLAFLKSSEFAYARFRPSGLGNYYSIYKKDLTSPTAVSLAFGLSEEDWDRLSKEAKRSNQYLAPGEKW